MRSVIIVLQIVSPTTQRPKMIAMRMPHLNSDRLRQIRMALRRVNERFSPLYHEGGGQPGDKFCFKLPGSSRYESKPQMPFNKLLK